MNHFKKMGLDCDETIIHSFLKKKFLPIVANEFQLELEYFLVNSELSTKNMNTHHWDLYKILIQEWGATILGLQINDPNELNG